MSQRVQEVLYRFIMIYLIDIKRLFAREEAGFWHLHVKMIWPCLKWSRCIQ